MVGSVGTATAAFAASSLSVDTIRNQAQQQASGVSDGADRENDGDGDDRGSVTATRGQNVNVLA